jgi:hypothetical protein
VRGASSFKKKVRGLLLALTAGSLILIADRRYWGKPDIEPTSLNGWR